jgi:PUA domain protein
MVKSRHPIRERDARDVSDALSQVFGADISWKGKLVEESEDGGFRLYFVDGIPMAFAFEGRVMPTVKGLLEHPAKERFVTVDEGAVKFVLNGADIMAPGVVDADPQVKPGDAVWIREEKHGRPLAVGLAIMSGPEMAAAEKGKAVRSVHHLRDKLWDLTQATE